MKHARPVMIGARVLTFYKNPRWFDSISDFILIFATLSKGSWQRRGTTNERSDVATGGLITH